MLIENNIQYIKLEIYNLLQIYEYIKYLKYSDYKIIITILF